MSNMCCCASSPVCVGKFFASAMPRTVVSFANFVAAFFKTLSTRVADYFWLRLFFVLTGTFATTEPYSFPRPNFTGAVDPPLASVFTFDLNRFGCLPQTGMMIAVFSFGHLKYLADFNS